ncbi:hypothetical protein GCM10023334_078550 [Nonomuraea thailandensis]
MASDDNQRLNTCLNTSCSLGQRGDAHVYAPWQAAGGSGKPWAGGVRDGPRRVAAVPYDAGLVQVAPPGGDERVAVLPDE